MILVPFQITFDVTLDTENFFLMRVQVFNCIFVFCDFFKFFLDVCHIIQFNVLFLMHLFYEIIVIVSFEVIVEGFGWLSYEYLLVFFVHRIFRFLFPYSFVVQALLRVLFHLVLVLLNTSHFFLSVKLGFFLVSIVMTDAIVLLMGSARLAPYILADHWSVL